MNRRTDSPRFHKYPNRDPVMPQFRSSAFLMLLLATSLGAAVPGYYRDPAIRGDSLVFSAEGDLWLAAADGGVARRLTTHPAQETQPAISADGRWLGFTASYDGSVEAYVMPLSGGTPRRVSFDGGPVRVQGWTPDGELLYAAATRSGSHWVLRAVDPENLRRRELPLLDAHQATFDDAGNIYFVRFGLTLTSDNARHYRGGAMAQLWRFAPDGASEAERMAGAHEGNITSPMWWRGQLYAISDATGTANLWRFDGDGRQGQQLTDHLDFEVRSASMGDGFIVYQSGADIRRFSIESGEDRLLSLHLATDRAGARERWLREPLKFIESLKLAPGGERAVLTARGQVALAGTGALRRVEIAVPPASRARAAVASPDGRSVYAIVDQAGEQEIWRFPADGSAPGEQLTRDGETQRLRLVVSPDGRYLAHDDRRGALWLLDTGNRRNRAIDDSGGDGYSDIAWSADSRYLAVSRPASALRRPQIVLYSLAEERAVVLTSDRYESFAPAFSADGRWLYFLSNRNFEPTPAAPWGDRNFGPMFDRRTRIYALALQPGNRFPLLPRDELTPDKPPGDGDVLPAIELDGLADRLFEVPVTAGNFRALAVAKDRLYMLDQEAARGSKATLKTVAFDTDKAKLETFVEGAAQFELSADRSKLMYRKSGDEGTVHIVPAGAKAPDKPEEAQVRLDDWRLAVRPAQEWRQMFFDAWRMHRDHLFDADMRGQDWRAIRDRYEPLLPRIGDRAELDDLLGQMAAELGVLHSQVRGGDYREDAERAEPAFLGGEFEQVDEGARIVHIHQGDPELPDRRAPLAAPGVDLREGDIIVSVNGRRVDEVDDIAMLLSHQAGQQVRLDYRRGRDAGSVVTTAVDAARAGTLRYSDWVQGRRAEVERASAGRIGYLHLRAMGPNDIADFAREFYANIDRQGLIVDVRRNRGGNIDSWVIEKLLRRAWSFWQAPHQPPFWNMQQTFRGHLVVLVDPLTYSDGETFAAGVKALELAPLIGARTAGAGVWLSDNNRLADRGMMRVAEWGQFDAEGRWMIEGVGVEPDIEIENPPHASWRGEDAQLVRAIAELERRLREAPVTQPPAAPIPPRAARPSAAQSPPTPASIR